MTTHTTDTGKYGGLTEAQIRDTVARSGYRFPEVILKRALSGDPHTLFAVHANFRRLNPDHPRSVA
jgi:hypothetical protein